MMIEPIKGSDIQIKIKQFNMSWFSMGKNYIVVEKTLNIHIVQEWIIMNNENMYSVSSSTVFFRCMKPSYGWNTAADVFE